MLGCKNHIQPAAFRILITEHPVAGYDLYIPDAMSTYHAQSGPSSGTVKFRKVSMTALAGAPPRLCWLIVPLSRTIYLGNLTWSEHAPNTRPHHTYINIAQCYANIHIQKSDKIFL